MVFDRLAAVKMRITKNSTGLAYYSYCLWANGGCGLAGVQAQSLKLRNSSEGLEGNSVKLYFCTSGNYCSMLLRVGCFRGPGQGPTPSCTHTTSTIFP